jgi:hypothetical protein
MKSTLLTLVTITLTCLAFAGIGGYNEKGKFVEYTVPAAPAKTMTVIRNYFVQMGYREDAEHVRKCSKTASAGTLVLRSMDHAGFVDADSCLLITPVSSTGSETTIKVELGVHMTGVMMPTTGHYNAKEIHKRMDDAFANIILSVK